jgi:uncharacterized membrane protein YgaE (UPF0421/DUF939 family)
MLDPNESRAILRLIRSDRKTTRQSLQVASLFALQAILSSSLLIAGYTLAHAHALTWAIVSAVLVIQPGIEQSLAASAVRIAANLVGGLIGLAVGQFLGLGYPQLLLALALTVFASEFLRIDLGLRTACVATIIVMTSLDGHVTTSALERLSAVLIGCLTAVGVQLLAEYLRRLAHWTDPFFPSLAAKPEPAPDNQE